MESQLSLNMSARLLEAVGPAIVRGDYSDRPFPNEAEASEEFGVSRTVIREAIKSLTAKGLVETRPRVGTRILAVRRWNLLDADVMRWIVSAPNSSGFLLEYADLRRGLSPMAAGLAAKSVAEAAMSQIEAALTDLKQAQAMSEKVSAIRRFHEAIVEASGNAIFMRLQATMAVVFDRSTERTLHAGGVNPDQYVAVVNAVRARDPNRAEMAMRWLLDDEAGFVGDNTHTEASPTRQSAAS